MKSFIKKTIMNAYCYGLIPSGLVRWAFSVLGLRKI